MMSRVKNMVILCETRGPKGHCCSPEYNERIKNLTSQWNQKQEAQRATYRAPEYNVPPFWQIGHFDRLQTGRTCIMVWWCPSVRVSVCPTLRPSVRLSVHPTLRPSGSPSARFPHFSHTCFEIMSWHFAHDFVLIYYRSSLSVVTLRQFFKELCLFVNLEYR